SQPIDGSLIGHDDMVTSVAFAPSGHLLASASNDKTILLWDVDKRRVLRSLSGHTDHVNSVAFNADGRTLASGGDDKTVRLWDLEIETPLLTLTPSSAVYSVAFRPDGKTFAAGTCGVEDKPRTVCQKGEVRLWNLTASPPSDQTLSAHSAPVLSVAFSKDGK